ncbi:tax1-binding protein 1 homolog B [Lepisosteus oculatus]|uniref:tax1-binding protein 1 homolog B n=1 Tax=Lepisosteus oculatus TaxID=7918 RepID=UPI0035F50E23
MAHFLESPSSSSAMETSNFAHVIFQNVAKGYLPHAALECHYTLTQYIKPHQKDWVGIFKVGWSTARDYYTFLWSPLPENYVEGTSVNRVVVFQGYYVPNDDGEFYQFCYVTHKGEIRGASTPFQFRASSPTDDLLTVEDENNSDILVVTTKAGFLEQKIEEATKEKEELLKVLSVTRKDKEQLQEQAEQLERLCEQARESFAQLSKECQELHLTSQTLRDEKEEMKKKYEEATSRIIQLEEDLIGVTQRGIEKETELDSIRDRVKKLTLEKENLESQLKNEKDEKELYKVHLKNTELENTKLSAELQTLKSVDVNKENMLTQLKEELGQLKICLTEKEKLQREILTNTSPKEEAVSLREQLRRTEEQLQATKQEVSMLAAELRDVSSVRDKTMSELYRARLEMDSLKKSLAGAEAERQQKEEQLQRLRTPSAAGQPEQGGAKVSSVAEQELLREVEDLKLRLQMAAEHYKEKYKECQKLQKQVARLTEQGESKKPTVVFGTQQMEAAAAENTPPASPASSEVALDVMVQEKLKGMNKEISEKSDKYRKCKQMLTEEKDRSSMYADELAKVEMKLKEQLKLNETLRLQLAAEEDRYQSQVAEKRRELKELKDSLALALSEKMKLVEELQKRQECRADAATGSPSSEPAQPGGEQQVFLQYPIPYPQEPGPAPLVPVRPPELQYGNPYAAQAPRDGADGEFSPDKIHRPPLGPPSWDSNVVCIQPARNLSRPDGLEDPEELSNSEDVAENMQSTPHDSHSSLLRDSRARFCFDSSIDVQKRCPLCEVIFPPNYDQSKFEEHVESHWKVCPMCNEQFPLDCNQQVFERHVMTHFDGNVNLQ